MINFPLPIAFKLDISGERDLNLNSSRTKVIYDEKWLEFENNFYKIIIERLYDKLDKKKWTTLKPIMMKNTKSQIINDILKSY